jgi:hypothetical protein
MWPSPYQPQLQNTSAGMEYLPPTVIAATASASAATLLPGNTQGDGAQPDIRIENQTAAWAMCNFGDASVAAATVSNGIGIAPNSAHVVRVAPSTAYVSVILSTGTGNVRFLRGIGGMD